MIYLEKATVGVQTTRLLFDIDWRIHPGEHWIVAGPMGAGKTTLVRALAGQARLFSGKISYPFLGKNDGFDERRRAIKLVSFSDASKLFRSVNNDHYYQQRYQAFDADGHLTVRQYLESGGYDPRLPGHLAVIRRTGLERLLELERIKLSSGQTRKMLIAKALICEPQVLILDNPYLGLDAPSRRVFNDYLDELASTGRTTIILAGQYEELPACITRRLELEQGRVRQSGPVEETNLAEDPSAFDVSPLPADMRAYFGRTPRSDIHSLIRLQKVGVSYGDKAIFQDLSWQVRPGEKWALLGDNGSGKSTILSLIYADNPQAYAKEIVLFDRRRGSGETIWDIKKRIGFTSSELHAYFPYDRAARDIVLTGLWDGFAIRGKPTPQQLEWTHSLFRFFQVEHLLFRPFHALSTGQQRLLFFLRALIKAPELLLLDEPFQGFDRPTIANCRRLLDELLDDRHALVFITHYRQEIPSLVDHILDLNYFREEWRKKEK